MGRGRLQGGRAAENACDARRGQGRSEAQRYGITQAVAAFRSAGDGGGMEDRQQDGRKVRSAIMMQPTNVTALLIAAVAAWIFGAIYYTIFSKVWIAARGETMESLKAK